MSHRNLMQMVEHGSALIFAKEGGTRKQKKEIGQDLQD
jgi:hypothetical protein